jgi:ascorbate-specific PTS system EIIC-type component UlaA
MVEIDKDGYFKTTNSAQVSVLLLFLSGQITYQDTIATIIMQGMVDDSFFTNVAMGVLANSSGGKSFSQLKLQKQGRADVMYRAFCKMLQIAQQVGSIKWQDNESATLIKIYPADIARD